MTSTTNKTVDRGNYTTPSQAQPIPLEREKKIAATQAATKLKDPSLAPTPALRLQAANSKLVRLMSNPKYQGLRDDHKMIVLKEFYGKYTQPALTGIGVQDPGFDRWVRGQHATTYDQDSRVMPTDRKGEFVSGVTEGWGDVVKLTGNLLRHRIPWAPKITNDMNAEASKRIMNYANGLDKMGQEYHSVFQHKPGALSFAANTLGHMIGESPAYLVVDAATSGLATPELLGASRVGRALKYAKEGGEIFAIDKGEGKTTKQAAADSVAGALIGFGLHAGSKQVRKAFSATGQQLLNKINAKGTQLALGGEPFANSVAAAADKIDGTAAETASHGLQSAVHESNPHLQQAANNEVWLREALAREFHPEKAKAAEGKSVWRNLSKSQRDKIKAHISGLTKVASEVMPLTSPHVQTLANEHEIAGWMEAAPENKALHQAIAAMTGLNPAEVLTEVQASEVAESLNLGTPSQNLDLAFNDGEEYEPQEGASASLKPDFSVNFARRKDNLSPKALVGAKADDFIHGSIKYLEDSPATKSGKIYFEHPEHHLLYIARHSSAPGAVKGRATKLLQSEFGHSPDKITKRAGWLKQHVDDLRRTGKLSAEGNIYRSTKLTARRYGTEWQKTLYTGDSITQHVYQLKALIKTQPQLKPILTPMLKQLLVFKNKAATPAMLAKRAEALDKVISGLQGMK